MGHAGLAFSPDVAKALVAATFDSSHSYIEVFSISGAFLLGDSDVSSVLSSNSETLVSVSLASCPNLGDETCSSISKLSNLSELSLQHCPLSLSQLIKIDWGAMPGLRR